MEAQAPISADGAQLAAIQRKLQLENRFRSGIGWFYWIAGLSLVNSIVYVLGARFSFVVGLGITQIVDAIVAGLIEGLGPSWSVLRVVGLGINILIAGIFLLIGYFGRKRIRWPVITGMALYGLDAILMLLLQDFLGAAFHAWALYGIWTGLGAMRQLEVLERPGGQPVPSLP